VVCSIKTGHEKQKEPETLLVSD